jgi:hypothetical protein
MNNTFLYQLNSSSVYVFTYHFKILKNNILDYYILVVVAMDGFYVKKYPKGHLKGIIVLMSSVIRNK